MLPPVLTHKAQVQNPVGEQTFPVVPGAETDTPPLPPRDLDYEKFLDDYEVKEALIPREALYLADEVFFTGTAAEVTPIREIDHHVIGSGRRGPVTTALQEAFFDVLQHGNDPYGWLTPVRTGVTA